MFRCLPAILAASFCLAAAEKTGQEVTASAVLDRDYRFKLEFPTAQWLVMGEEKVKVLNADAVAGATAHGAAFRGAYGIVIVESAPGVKLTAYARFLLENMTVEDKNVIHFDAVAFHEKPAVRYEVRGKAQGLDMRFSNTVVLHDEHAYQIFCWGLAERTADRVAFKAFRHGFSFLEGPVRGRSTRPLVRNAQGPGWRVKERAFVSSSYDFAIKPPSQWHLLVGDDLASVNADAEVGLALARPDAWICFIPERIVGVNRRTYVLALENGFRESIGEARGLGSIRLPFCGASVEFKRFRTTGQPPIEYIQRVHVEGTLCVNVLVWYIAGHAEAVAEHLPGALASFRFMAPDEAQTIRRELSATPDLTTSIGLDYSLRRGVYRDFARGIQWRRPRTGFWQINAGPAARQIAPDAELIFEASGAGFFGVLVAEDLGDMQPRQYHAAVLRGALTGDHEAQRRDPGAVTLGGTTFLETHADQLLGKDLFRYRILTGVVGTTAVQLIVSGFKGNMEAAAESVERAIRGLSVPGAKLKHVERGPRSYKDLRLGFRLTFPDENWTLKDMTPPAVRPLGAAINVVHGERTFNVLAVSGTQERQGEEWIQQFMTTMIRSQASLLPDLKPREGSETTLGGRPCRHRYWDLRGKTDAAPKATAPRLDVYIVREGRTVFALLESTKGGASGRDFFGFLD